jgi:SNF2 family DNA or RNA helicase
MLVLHAHWQPPRSSNEAGSVLFWAETSAAPAAEPGPKPARGTIRVHPFCASRDELMQLLGGGMPAATVLRLPSAGGLPLPSPALVADWEPEREALPHLVAWTIEGLGLPPAAALQGLVNLPSLAASTPGLALADDARFWQTAAGLAMEALAAGKILPVLVESAKGEDGPRKVEKNRPEPEKQYHARWTVILDGPNDAERLARLERSMPALCRASTVPGIIPEPPPPQARALLDSFLNTACDGLVRMWGSREAPIIGRDEKEPGQRWLAALFSYNPIIEGSQAQLQAFAGGHRAWMRNLHVAGDRTFRIAFRLDAPKQAEGQPNSDRWSLDYFLQARDDPSLLVPADLVWQSRGAALTQLGRRFERPQEKMLAALGYASRLFPALVSSLKENTPTSLSMDPTQAYGFLREAAPLLQDAGFGLMVPPWWNQKGARLGVRLRLSPGQKGSIETISRMKLSSLVNYQWELSVGDTSLTKEEFENLVALKSPLVQIRGQWVQLDAEQVEAAISFWENHHLRGEVGLLEAVRMNQGLDGGFSGLPVDDVQAEGWLADWLVQFNQATSDDPTHTLLELPQPGGLNGELRPYQRYGFSWLDFFQRWRLGAVLADDMGLGKTIQTLAMLLYQKETNGSLPGPSLLIAPTSVVTNWEREVRRFTPGLTTLVHHGPARLRNSEFMHAAQNADLVLTSYAIMRQDIDTLLGVRWYGVILDEAQNIKNPAARQTQSVRKLHGDFRLALTGTPVENRLSELWSIMNFLNPGYLGVRQSFRSEFGVPIERYHDAEATTRLKSLVGPFILRRVKSDPRVIQDLPEKLETRVYCELTEEQATLYEAVVQTTMAEVDASDGIQRKGLVLAMLTKLKQICNHPAQFLHENAPESAPEMAGRSGKLERLGEMLEEIMEVGDHVLVFTQFAEMGKMLNTYLPQKLGISTLFLSGDTPALQRDQLVRRFQEDEHAPSVFVLSLKAGGTGLNLTRANHVFHFDRWWNPAVENQATDRAFRIGQTRNVQVHKFVTIGTMEEMIDELIESKKDLAQMVIGSGEQWLTELSTDDLRSLVSLRRN